MRFQSMLPCGERLLPERHHGAVDHFNPCSPCGERRPWPAGGVAMEFQSMLPVRGATLLPEESTGA
ncbi:MAG: hypothetical protein ACLU9S_10035 [Oscillospiraceae bacterium]